MIDAIQVIIGLSRANATLLAGIFGFLGGIISSFGIYWWRLHIRRRKLRRAIYVELQTASDLIEQVEDMDTTDEISAPTHTNLPTKVYDTNTNDIGLLSERELKYIIPYYNTASVAKEQLNNLNNESVRKGFLNETVPILQTKRQRAENVLRTRLKRFGRFRHYLSSNK